MSGTIIGIPTKREILNQEGKSKTGPSWNSRKKAVESRLENAILERIESFRREISKIKKAK